LAVAWAGFLFLAIFDDVTSWLMHMIGVLSMVCGVICCFVSFNRNAPVQTVLICVFCICLLYALRLLMKGLVVVGIEMEQPLFDYNTWKSIALNTENTRGLISEKIMQIMYNGSSSCKYPQYTMVFFKATGVMQWLFFWMLVESLSCLKWTRY